MNIHSSSLENMNNLLIENKEDVKIDYRRRLSNSFGEDYNNRKMSIASKGSTGNTKFDELPLECKIWTEKDWKNTEDCEICYKPFSGIFAYRHHCRRCGKCVCEECSTKKRRLSKKDTNFYRICENCDIYFAHKKVEDDLIKINEDKDYMINERNNQLEILNDEIHHLESKLKDQILIVN